MVKEEPSPPPTLLEEISPARSGVHFANNIRETKAFNYLRYSYMYNGGGVAVGDIDGDGLTDIYFTANQGSNKLYLNKGDFRFEDITQSAGVSDSEGWTTGVCMVDINGNGLLDIYVCKSGPSDNLDDRRNLLYINNGDLTFTEQAAAWGIDDPAHSTMAYFFDYDGDGDLDLFLLNHRIDFLENVNVDLDFQCIIDPSTTDKLYRNDGNRFTDVTSEAGLSNKAWGLGAAVADYNSDGLPDIFVCNDYRQPDHLYLNNGDGTFRDGIHDHFGHISFYTMGADAADFNNDGHTDLAVLDMVSEDHVRSKRMMAAMSTANFREMVDIGYHHQYMFNMLHLNRGNGDFSNIAHLAGVAKTDWSWAPLFADLDNDGWLDLIITNGIDKDVTDVDFKTEIERRFMMGQPMSFQEAMERWPAAKIPNYAFRNTGDLRFENASVNWGLDRAVNSNGIAYADLNNDGALDLIINNLNDPASIYRNNSKSQWLRVELSGPEGNRLGLGTRVEIEAENGYQQREMYMARGFQSSVEPVLHFGLGELGTVNTLRVIWPDGKTELKRDVQANQKLTLHYQDAGEVYSPPQLETLFEPVNGPAIGIDFVHRENDFDDFAREILLPHKQSTWGPHIAVGDINGDGLDDFFVGNAKGAEAATFIQTAGGKFIRSNHALWKKEADYEDIGALFFDANGNGHLDLYVVSGGNERPPEDAGYQDRLYLNDGKGNFQRAVNALPQITGSGQCVIAADIDGDGDLDLFVGGKQYPGIYPYPGKSYILRNDGGTFSDITDQFGPELRNIGMVSDAVFADYNNDGLPDLAVVCEWSPIMLFKNTGNQLAFDRNTSGLEKSNAWWYGIHAADMDGDGDIDFVVGNLGQNNKFQPSTENPLHVFCHDFDGNGTYDIVLSKEKKGTLLPVRGRECSSEQMPFIAMKFPSYRSFAEADLRAIYGAEALAQALHLVAYDFSSVYLENLGNGRFKRHELPAHAQFGPLMSIDVRDVNGDGVKDIIGVGNMYNAEVETVRYDACRGFVLLGDGEGGFDYEPHSGFYHFSDARSLATLNIAGQLHYIIGANNGALTILKHRKRQSDHANK